MKALILAMVSIFLTHSNVNACTPEAVKTAEEIHKRAEKDFESGMATSSGPLQAKIHVLEMKICEKPNDKTVCRDLISTLSKAFESTKNGQLSSLYPMSMVISLHSKLVYAKMKCDM